MNNYLYVLNHVETKEDDIHLKESIITHSITTYKEDELKNLQWSWSHINHEISTLNPFSERPVIANVILS